MTIDRSRQTAKKEEKQKKRSTVSRLSYFFRSQDIIIYLPP
jgi:hypothetical protein